MLGPAVAAPALVEERAHEPAHHLDPLLESILAFLDDHATVVEQVRQDLVRGLKNPNTGRDGITPSQTLRSLILMRVKNWDYRELRERINDGYLCKHSIRFIAIDETD